ncbi:4F2 cell-surface antigen heavy chain-like isoform X4 [Triplophysa rosa]|uniref:4F2 cell-surface antigen heavy chain-like isoform X4 n=1 Tax=Triplophysa rosa TaxID=992332 RepID=UPI002545F9BC|nr:4F2 cell-surface antigen heavy chain-like isoform X4 [Triplophysa rosa]
MDQEKQPMTRKTTTANEKNGCVKVTIPEDTGVKFTGLSKDELMKIAGTAGWILTRRALLVLFWLGWVGILAGAVVIIEQAPRCKPIPEMNWWNEGPLYQISNVKDFSDRGLKGTENELRSLLDQAHKKGISIVLNLTPNYEQPSAWFSNATTVAEKLREACKYWIDKGFDGIFMSALGDIVETETWPSIQAIFNKTDGNTKRVLMGSVNGLSMNVDNVSCLLNRSGADLLTIELSDPRKTQEVQNLYSNHLQTSMGWSLSRGTLGTPESIRLFHALLFTLPGTPVFNAGDEMALKAGEKPKKMWDLESPAEKASATTKAVQKDRITARDFFKAFSDLRRRERALLHGEFINLNSSASSLAFLRLWDQSERFITAINWGNDTVPLTLTNSNLPAQAQVRICIDTTNLAVDSMVSLKTFQLGPLQAVLLSFPYAG